jgi:purine-cytosine permease-like protein
MGTEFREVAVRATARHPCKRGWASYHLGMAENDEAGGSEAADTPYEPTGLRRSTFTPPASDAAQAAALSADGAFADAGTGDGPDTAGSDAGADDGGPAASGPADAGSDDGEPVQPDRPVPSRAAPVAAPEELPDRPRRRSLDDDDLVRKLSPEVAEPGATLDAIEEFQAQLLLRQEEARQFSEWESGMRAIGTPEALESIAQAIPEFTGVIPIVSPEQNADYLARMQPPVQADVPAPAAAPEPASVQYMDPEAYPPPRLEERVDAAPLDEPNLSDHLVFQPPWKREPAPEESPALPEVPESAGVPGSAEVLEAPEFGTAQEELGPETVHDPGLLPEAQRPEESAPTDQLMPEQPLPEQPIPDASMEEAPMEEDLAPVDPAPESLAPESPAPVDLAEASELQLEPDVVEESEQLGDASAGEQPAEEEPGLGEPVADEPVEDMPAVDAPVIYELVDPPSGSVPLVPPPSASLFDRLLSGDVMESADEVAAPFPVLDVPLLDVPQPGEPAMTASQPIVLPIIEEEPDDDVDDVDRALGEQPGAIAEAPAAPFEPEAASELPATTGEAAASGAEAVPVQPLASSRVQTNEQVLVAEQAQNQETQNQAAQKREAQKQPVFGLELSGIEPTPMEHRVGRAARMFWMWFATNASVVSVAFGAALLGLGMSLRQAILAAFIGVAISFLPLGLGTLAGKWSGQPTIVVSRATFGLVGNIVPAVLALLTRLFWGAVLLWLLAVCAARILVGASLAGPFNEMQLTLVVVAVGFVIAFLVAFLGYPLFARLQFILSVVSAVLILGLFVVTWNTVDIGAALSIGDGPWVLVITGVVLVFSFIGLLWANGSGDIARYQRPGSSGASASLWASFGATLPAFLLIAYGALLAASSPSLFTGFQTIPLDTIATLIPAWYPIPLIAATVLSLLSAVALSVYSGGFALQAVGVRLERQWAVVAVGVVIFGIAIVMALSDAGFADVFRDLATSIAVPVAAWAGIFAAEMMIRRRHFDTGSLLRPGGIYPSVNWINFAMLFVASALGFAFTSAAVGWLSWQGYGFVLLGIPLGGPVGTSDLGVLVALAIGLLTPLVAGVRAVRRQESARR